MVSSNTFVYLIFCACSGTHFFCVYLGLAAARLATTFHFIIWGYLGFLCVCPSTYIHKSPCQGWLQGPDIWSCRCSLSTLFFLFYFWYRARERLMKSKQTMSDGKELFLVSHLPSITWKIYYWFCFWFAGTHVHRTAPRKEINIWNLDANLPLKYVYKKVILRTTKKISDERSEQASRTSETLLASAANNV